MTQVPTNRTAASSIAEHTSDHNVFAAQHNELDGHAADTAAHDLDATIAAAIAALVAAAPGTLDTLNELAAALGDDADFAATITTALGTKATTAALATHEADTTGIHGITDTTALETTTGSAAKVAAHESDTSVHGIADTTVLATDAEVTAAVAAHAVAGDPHTGYATDSDLSGHAADTTAIHGIADTSALETTSGSTAKVAAHEGDTSAAHAASAVAFTPTGTIAATDVQAAIAEVAAEAGGSHPDLAAHDSLGLATQAELDAAIAGLMGTTVSFSPTGGIAATDVSGALAELDSEKETAGVCIPKSLVDAAGDLLVGTANDTVGRLAIGTALYVLRVNAAGTALEYAAASSGGGDMTFARMAFR